VGPVLQLKSQASDGLQASQQVRCQLPLILGEHNWRAYSDHKTMSALQGSLAKSARVSFHVSNRGSLK
jgi:hypothetical protein